MFEICGVFLQGLGPLGLGPLGLGAGLWRWPALLWLVGAWPGLSLVPRWPAALGSWFAGGYTGCKTNWKLGSGLFIDLSAFAGRGLGGYGAGPA